MKYIVVFKKTSGLCGQVASGLMAALVALLTLYLTNLKHDALLVKTHFSNILIQIVTFLVHKISARNLTMH